MSEMTNQSSLFEQTGTPLDRTPQTLDERFDAYHEEHPEVYDLLVRYARQAKTAGHSRYSIKTIMEVVRWDRSVAVPLGKGEAFHLNNSYGSRYARLIMEECADLADFFETRVLTSKTEDGDEA